VRAFYGDGSTLSTVNFLAYNVMKYGVNVACGDIDDDHFDEIITGPGPGANLAPQVRAFTKDGSPVAGVNFQAYGVLKYGVNVACGDIDGDGFDEIVTGAGPGAVFGPHVRGWNYDSGPESQAISEVNVLAYGTYKWGINVACGDIDGDGIDEIVTGAGPGPIFGPHVRAWNYDGGSETKAISDVNVLAYGTYKWGVNVACEDVDGDGIDEIITTPGPGPIFGAHVRGWNCDNKKLTPISSLNFIAYDNSYRYGAVAAVARDLDYN